MVKKDRKHKDQGAKAQSVGKGKVVERITAMMHEMPGVKVEPNVSLPAIDGSGRTREKPNSTKLMNSRPGIPRSVPCYAQGNIKRGARGWPTISPIPRKICCGGRFRKTEREG